MTRLPLLLALACLVCSVVASTKTARRPWLNEKERTETHFVAVTLALWAIALLQVWNGIR